MAGGRPAAVAERPAGSGEAAVARFAELPIGYDVDPEAPGDGSITR